jgi:5-methylcytosine-specific restriction endonuclease McrA
VGRALLLNAGFEPLDVVRDRDAVVLFLGGHVEVIEESGRYFHSPSTVVPVPSVMRLIRYIRVPNERRCVVQSTRNVLTRDGYICAYCGGVADTRDHIVPRARGGKNTWSNVTACCRSCNSEKGDKTLGELGWAVTRECGTPNVLVPGLVGIRHDPLWSKYLIAA